MKNKVKSNLVLVAVVIFTFLSCSKENNDLRDPIYSISKFVTFHGDLESETIVINTQGGPVTSLENGMINKFISDLDIKNTLFVNVHQTQTLNPKKFRDNDITFEEAKKADLESVETLKKVVDFYKNQKGKKVYVLGMSFGALMTQELIATYGIDVADGYLIMVGRLDIDKENYEAYSKGFYTKYIYDADGNYTIKSDGKPQDIESRNMARLAAGLGYNRYTEKLKDFKDLSKITYIYGDRDPQVGPLSAQEKKFLESRKANVILNENGTHNGTAEKGLKMMKDILNIN